MRRQAVVAAIMLVAGVRVGQAQSCQSLRVILADAPASDRDFAQATRQLSVSIHDQQAECESAALAALCAAEHTIDQLSPICEAVLRSGSDVLLHRLVGELARRLEDTPAQDPRTATRISLGDWIIGRTHELNREDAAGVDALGELAARCVSADADPEGTVPNALRLAGDPSISAGTRSRLSYAILRFAGPWAADTSWNLYFNLLPEAAAELARVAASGEGLDPRRLRSIGLVLAAAHAPEYAKVRDRIVAGQAGSTPEERGDIERWRSWADRVYEISASDDSVLAFLGSVGHHDGDPSKEWAIGWLARRHVAEGRVRVAVVAFLKAERERIGALAASKPEWVREEMMRLAVDSVRRAAREAGIRLLAED